MKIKIDQKTADVISEFAALNEMQPEAVVAQSIQNPQTQRYWRERGEDMAAIKHYRETGEGISQQAMEAKMDKMIQQIKEYQKQD